MGENIVKVHLEVQARTMDPTMEEVEFAYIEQVVEICKGNKTAAAKMLGFDRRTLYRKMRIIEKEKANG